MVSLATLSSVVALTVLTQWQTQRFAFQSSRNSPLEQPCWVFLRSAATTHLKTHQDVVAKTLSARKNTVSASRPAVYATIIANATIAIMGILEVLLRPPSRTVLNFQKHLI